MGTTPIYAIPYVEPADSVQAYPAADKAQALAVEAALSTYVTPYASRVKSTSQNLTTPNTWYPVTFEADAGSGGGITYSNGIFAVPRAGIYQVNACALFAGSASAPCRLSVNVGSTSLTQPATNGFGTSAMTISKAYRLSAGDTLSLQAWSSSSGQSVTGSSVRYTNIDITLIAP